MSISSWACIHRRCVVCGTQCASSSILKRYLERYLLERYRVAAAHLGGVESMLHAQTLPFCTYAAAAFAVLCALTCTHYMHMRILMEEKKNGKAGKSEAVRRSRGGT